MLGLRPRRGPLNPSVLLQTPMIDFNLPRIQGVEGTFLQRHIQATGGPVFNVAVYADYLEHLDPALRAIGRTL